MTSYRRADYANWRDAAWAIHELVANPNKPVVASQDDGDYMVLAIAGEAGEFANKLTKVWRGDLTLEAATEGLAEELADIAIYDELLARILTRLTGDQRCDLAWVDDRAAGARFGKRPGRQAMLIRLTLKIASYTGTMAAAVADRWLGDMTDAVSRKRIHVWQSLLREAEFLLAGILEIDLDQAADRKLAVVAERFRAQGKLQ